jgi:CRISPR-associated endonuclease/helicase Cas3
MNAENFQSFFEELHRRSPFPWQSRLARRVANEGWPALLDLPTSAGKTATIDIALFHLALEATKQPQERRAARRIFFVVDRRLVVDEAYRRACFIAQRLEQALQNGDGLLAQVAHRLVSLSGEENSKPVEVIRLRGGLPRERAFIRNPLQPAIVLSTVDQVGSRLLFRGYGVSEFMQPIHAALVGLDCLIILDEAHLSRPFVETMYWVSRYQSEAWAEKVVGRPATIVQTTATPSPHDNAFHLEDDDWKDPILSGRLKSSKPAELMSIKENKDDLEGTPKALASTFAAEATALMAHQREAADAPVVGIIANRVAVARMVFEQLNEMGGADAVLLTGRIRPWERDKLLDEYLPRMRAGRSADANPRPLFVIATQTVEVGADLDFDALVTEAAALDALRQRFGRLNRLGNWDNCRAVVVYVNYGQSKVTDPIYGEALTETWKWMEKIAAKPRGGKRKVMDFGIQAMKDVLPKGDELVKLISPSTRAPVLMPAHIDMLAQTSPPPAVEPEIALYLHGAESQPPDVQIVWRADLPATLGEDNEEAAIATISVLPPTQMETLAVPIWTARAFLQGTSEEDISDVEGSRAAKSAARRRKVRHAVRWRSADDSGLVDPDDLRPGNTIVVPASYGGLDRFGWHPGYVKSVVDIAEEAARRQRGKVVFRIHLDLITQWFEVTEASEAITGARSALEDALARFREGEDLSAVCGELIDRLLTLDSLKPDIRERLQTLRHNRREIPYPYAEEPQGILLQEKVNKPQEFTDDDDTSSLTRQVPLEDHCRGVGELAKVFATHCGLKAELVEDLSLAGRLHDLGKADLRFQAWLWGGDRIAARKAGKLLAKTAVLGVNDRNAIRVAREQAGYPQGVRHECYSVAMAIKNENLLKSAHDRDLVLYLVGAHHGRGRPFMPAVDDEGMKQVTFVFDDEQVNFGGPHGLERLDQGWTDRFWSLIRRYGYWGLTYLEMLVRLADHRRSEQGE